MTEHEKQMENCSHAWVFDHIKNEEVFLRCPRCGMLRPAYPGEPAARVSRELRIRHDGKDGDV